jgi:hypothetical protein
MKKLWILLVVLAVMGAAPLFADVTLSGEFMGWAGWDFSNPGGSGFPKVEINGMAEVMDFNTLKFELDSEGDDWGGGSTAASGAPDVVVDDFRLITDWGAALGLPVGVKTTVGYFDTYFTGWYYYDNTGYAFYWGWPNGLINQGPTAAGAMQVDIAAGPVNVHWWNDGAGAMFMAGADASFGGLSAWLAYGSRFDDFGGGTLSIEAAYNVMDMANVGAFFRYGLGGDYFGLGDTAASGEFTTGVNVGAGFGMFHAALGLEGDSISADFLDNIVVELTAAPIEAAKIAVAAFMDLGGPEAFAGLNVEADYTVGGATFALGYMYTPDATVAAEVNPAAYLGADQFYPDGLYAAFYIAY